MVAHANRDAISVEQLRDSIVISTEAVGSHREVEKSSYLQFPKWSISTRFLDGV